MSNYFDLSGKTALITGASRGLGARFSKVLSESGCNIIAVARNESNLSNLCDQIEEQGGRVRPIKMDISDPSAIISCVDSINKSGDKIDILINNATGSALTPISSPHIEEWQQHLNTNLLGPWILIQKISQHMISNAIAGSIINIASINGEDAPCTLAAAYCSTKAGLIQLTKQLVGELSPHQIRINTISPGLFYTDMTKNNIDENKEELEGKIPLGFIANPDDLDAAILFLSSNKASRYMTGACLTIDGGASANCRVL